MLRTLTLVTVGLTLAVPVLARGHRWLHSHSSYSHSGMHEHFASVVHQNRGGHIVTIRPRHARALHFFSKKY